MGNCHALPILGRAAAGRFFSRGPLFVILVLSVECVSNPLACFPSLFEMRDKFLGALFIRQVGLGEVNLKTDAPILSRQSMSSPVCSRKPLTPDPSK